MVASVRKERRIGLDRRQFTYDLHIPERRRSKDRRHAAIADDEGRLHDLSRELVERLISDSCLFYTEDNTEPVALDDHAE